MEHLLKQVEDRTESVIKKHCDDWLSCEVTTLEKAFPYLPPTLMALLVAKSSDKEKAADVLEFLQKNEFDGKWAQKPEDLLHEWKKEDKEVVPKVERAYEFIMDEYHQMALEQLQSTGDLKLWQLKRLLPYLSAILMSTLAEWVSEEQADQDELLSFLKDHYEEIKRATPSKLMEILKQDSAFGEKEREEDEEEEEKEKISLPSYQRMWPYLVGIVGLSIIILWLNSPDLSEASEFIPWKRSKEKVEEVSNPRLWLLDQGISLQLKGDDPMNKFVERLVGVAPDSNRQFFLKNVSWKDTLLPSYYVETINHLKTLHSAYPKKHFHINIRLIQQKINNSGIPIDERLNLHLQEQLAGMIRDESLTYSIDLDGSGDWSPDISDELVLHAEMEWTIIIRK